MRCLRNQMTNAYIAKEKEGADRMELEHFTLGGLRKAVFDGDVKTGSVMAGQVAGMLHEIKPLRQILKSFRPAVNSVLQNWRSKMQMGTHELPCPSSREEWAGCVHGRTGGVAACGGMGTISTADAAIWSRF